MEKLEICEHFIILEIEMTEFEIPECIKYPECVKEFYEVI